MIQNVSAAEIEIAAGPDNPCYGDSGGPLLLRTTSGEIVVGIAHTANAKDCVSGANYLRTDVFADFVKRQLAR